MGNLNNVFGLTSHWYMVCIAFERLLVVLFPIKARWLTSKNKAICALVTIVAIIVIGKSNIWLIDFSKENCAYREELTEYKRFSEGVVNLVLNNILPLLIVSVCYITIVVSVRRSNKRRIEMTGQTKTQTTNDRLTITALWVCLAFLILVAPSGVFLLLSRIYNLRRNYRHLYKIFDTLVMLLRQINYALNFFLYFISNKQFRNVALRLIRHKRRVAPGSSGVNTVSAGGTG